MPPDGVAARHLEVEVEGGLHVGRRRDVEEVMTLVVGVRAELLAPVRADDDTNAFEWITRFIDHIALNAPEARLWRRCRSCCWSWRRRRNRRRRGGIDSRRW